MGIFKLICNKKYLKNAYSSYITLESSIDSNGIESRCRNNSRQAKKALPAALL